MPELNTRSRSVSGGAEPIGPAREQRIDPPHRLANGRDDEALKIAATLAAGASDDVDSDVELASLAMVQQLRLQAQQLSEHLGRQQADIDRREAELQARAAHLEQQERNNRLWLKDRHEELAERESILVVREAKLQERARQIDEWHQHQAQLAHDRSQDLDVRQELFDRRAGDLQEADETIRRRLREIEAAASALQDATCAHEELVRDLERRTAHFDARFAAAFEMITRFLAGEAIVPARPRRRLSDGAMPTSAQPHNSAAMPSAAYADAAGRLGRDEFDELAGLLDELHERRKRITEAESLLNRAQSEVNELRHSLLADRKQFEAQRQGDQQRQDEFRRRAQSDLERRREALDAANQQLEMRRAALDQMRAELTVAQREALETRLVTEELLAQLSGAVPSAQLSHQIVRSRAALAECFRLQQEDIVCERRKLETLAAQIMQQHEGLAEQKRELEQWLGQRHKDVETFAAGVALRESELNRQQEALDKQRFDWEHERQEYQSQIRRLLAELGQ